MTIPTKPATTKTTKYFPAISHGMGFVAHKDAQALLKQKREEGFVGYESSYGLYGFSVTYWKPEEEGKC